jgi:hypothetical protein
MPSSTTVQDFPRQTPPVDTGLSGTMKTSNLINQSLLALSG